MQGERMKREVNEVHFTLPSLPLSHNSLYQIIFSQRRVELKDECRRWKSEMKQYVPRFVISEGSSIEITAAFYYPFHYKNGRPRRFDSANLLKLLIDTIAEKCGFDDSLIRCGNWRSIDSQGEQVEVTLREIASLQP